MTSEPSKSLKFFIIAGEHSGDTLGAKLMQALKVKCDGHNITFSGLGGEAMNKEGLRSLFPIDEVAVMGPIAILARLPNLIKRGKELVEAVVNHKPDILIIIDSPELTHRIAERVRKKAPNIPIINYVSPTVWAWRPGRAKKMRPYVDEVLALLPFEPEKHRELGGPPCHYVGHPLIELKPWVDNLDENQLKQQFGIDKKKPVLVVLPGSRPNEVKHLLEPFGKTITLIEKELGPIEIILPTVRSVRKQVEEGVKKWKHSVHFIENQDDKFAAFKCANAAIAASGTVTLELAIAGTPMIVAYKYDRILQALRWLIKTEMFALANLILGYKCFPELIQKECSSENLASHLIPLFSEHSQQSIAQKKGLDEIINQLMAAGQSPSLAAAERVLKNLQNINQ